MKIWAKIGTHSSEMIQVKHKRKPPKVGDYIFFKRYPYSQYGVRWESGLIWKANEVDGEILYFIDL